MSVSDLERLLVHLQREPGLRHAAQALLATPAALARWASDLGYQLSAADLEALVGSGQELTDEELDQAAGGDWTPPPPPGSGGGGG